MTEGAGRPGGERKGFGYVVTPEMVEEYRRWPIVERLAWLEAGRRLHDALPERIRKLHDRFRAGEL